jgi:hypothetical protein
MPLVFMKRSFRRMIPREGENFLEVKVAMPQIVADALSAPADHDGELGPEDVNVWEMPMAAIAYGDICNCDLEIVIFAHNFPSRMANIDERRQQIIDKVRLILQKGTTFFVRVICSPTSWGEGVGEAE